MNGCFDALQALDAGAAGKDQSGAMGSAAPSRLGGPKQLRAKPMVRGFLLNGSWPGAKASSQVLPEPVPEPIPVASPQPEPQPTAESTPVTEATTSPPADNSSLSLMIRVVQPTEQESEPIDVPRQESGLRRLFRTIRRKAA